VTVILNLFLFKLNNYFILSMINIISCFKKTIFVSILVRLLFIIDNFTVYVLNYYIQTVYYYCETFNYIK